MEMERSPSMSQRVIQQAKEELAILEAQHPNRFHSLKLDLESFILLHSQNLFLINSNSNASSSSPFSSSSQPPHQKIPSSTSSSAATQASSNSSRKRKRVGFDDEESNKQKSQRVDGDRVDEVLKRAQVCLQRIKDLKTNFFCS